MCNVSDSCWAVWNVFDVALRNPAQPDDSSGRGSCVFLWTGRFSFFFFFWCVCRCGSHACRYSGCTRATLRNSLAWVSGHCISHQLMGTIWAPGTQNKDGNGRRHKSWTASRRQDQCYTFLGKCNSTPVCSQRVLQSFAAVQRNPSLPDSLCATTTPSSFSAVVSR